MSKNDVYIFMILLNVLSYIFPTLLGLVIVIDIFVGLALITNFILEKWYFKDF